MVVDVVVDVDVDVDATWTSRVDVDERGRQDVVVRRTVPLSGPPRLARRPRPAVHVVNDHVRPFTFVNDHVEPFTFDHDHDHVHDHDHDHDHVHVNVNVYVNDLVERYSSRARSSARVMPAAWSASPSATSAMRRLRSWRARMRSSTVSLATMR